MELKTRCMEMMLIFLIINLITICSVKNASAAAFHTSKNGMNRRESVTISLPGIIEPRSSLTAYDQRQNGKYNIRVSIKDVKIIAVNKEGLEDNLDDDTIYDYGDYDYDPAHLTVNPLPIFGIGSVSITTSKPSKSTSDLPVQTTAYHNYVANSKPLSPSSSSALPDQIKSTTESYTTPKAVPLQMSHTESSYVYTSDEILSTGSSLSLSSEPSHSTADQAQTTVKPSRVSNTSIHNLIQVPGQYDYQEIPVKVIIEPITKSKI